MWLETNQLEVIYQLLFAAFLGAIIGIEREFLKKAAGLRTYVMVSMGCALFTISASLAYGTIEGSRVTAGILTGMGFIGAGTILKKENKIEGITTAAALWVTTAIGIAVGLKLYIIALFTALLTLLFLVILRPFEFWLNKKTKDPEKEGKN
jgi:putative Mg2+ transporter-C (MgtC) family protein